MDIFLSYSRTSSLNEARVLKNSLEKKGISVFLDETEIPAGGSFPLYLAEELLSAKLVLILADVSYFSKPWCLYEFKVCLAPYYQAVKNNLIEGTLDHIIFALPKIGDISKIIDYLPSPLKEIAWLKHDETEKLVNQLCIRLQIVTDTLGNKLKGLDDDAVISLRNGALINAASKLPHKFKYIKYLPQSLKEKFAGRADKLWEIFIALESKGVQELCRSVVLEGGGGMGKTQLAAEYLWRYGGRHYPGGVIWINADCTEEELKSQFIELIECFLAPQKEVFNKDSYSGKSFKEINDEIIIIFNNLPLDQTVLWIADNVPEPIKDISMKPINYWCPVKDNVSLLCTSRQANLSFIDTNISISELSTNASIEFITQSPVKKNWYKDYEWQEIVHWVGCWPMGLRILHASLGDNIITQDALLLLVQGNNPSSSLDETVNELKGFVEDGYVKGVTELFKLSYEDLKNYPEASIGAHILARLARIPLPEKLLYQLIPGNAIAILGKRHWIEASNKTEYVSSKHWKMHRIVASFFKSIVNDEEKELEISIKWFKNSFSSGQKWDEIKVLDTHFRVFTDSLTAWLTMNHNSELLSEAKELALLLAVYELENIETRGLRFIATKLVIWLGEELKLIEIYEKEYSTGNIAKGKGIAYCLGIFHSEHSAKLLIRIFSDSNEDVRWQGLLQMNDNPNAEILIFHWFEAMMLETNENVIRNMTKGFGKSFDNISEKNKVELITRIVFYINSTLNEKQYIFIISLIGSLIQFYGNAFSVSSFIYSHLNDFLLKIVLESSDLNIIEEASKNLSNEYDGGITFKTLIKALSFEVVTDKILLRFNALIFYIRGLARPKPPKNVSTIFNDEGGMKMNFQFGEEGINIAPFYKQIINLISKNFTIELRDQMICIIGERNEGLSAIQEEIHSFIDNQEWAEVLNISNSVLNNISKSEFTVFKVNALWWRGQAYSKLNYLPEAIEDFTEVIVLAPEFTPARERRLELNYTTNNTAGKIEDLEFFSCHSPENWTHFHNLGGCYLDIKDYEKALVNLENCIEINNQSDSAWYLKSYSNFYLNNTQLAKVDINNALVLNPENKDYLYFKNYLENL